MGSDLEGLFRYIRPIFLRAPQFFDRSFVSEGQSYYRLARTLASTRDPEVATD
jgi:hypothetical protein